MTAPRRPAELAPLDPWAEISLIQEKQNLIRLEADIEQEKRDDAMEAAAKADAHSRALSRHTQYGYVGITLVIVAAILGVIFLIHMKMDNGAEQRLRSESLRTEQVQACTTLDEPIERQYCLLTLNVPESESR